MAEKLIYKRYYPKDKITVHLVVDEVKYSPEQEKALWSDLVRAVSSAIK